MLEVTVTGLDQVSAAFRRVERSAREPMFRAVDQILRSQVARTFQAGRDPETGAPWRRTGALALSTRPSGGGKTLLATGQLRNSIVSRSPDVSDSHVRIGSNLPYSAIHQTGGTIAPKSAKKLAIPLTKDARRAGSARRWWAINAAKKPFILKGKTIATREAGGLKFHFALVDSVDMPPRPFVGLGREYANEIERFIVGFVEMSVEAGGTR